VGGWAVGEAAGVAGGVAHARRQERDWKWKCAGRRGRRWKSGGLTAMAT